MNLCAQGQLQCAEWYGSCVDEFLFSYSSDFFVCVCVCLCAFVCVSVWCIPLTSYLHKTLSTYNIRYANCNSDPQVDG